VSRPKGRQRPDHQHVADQTRQMPDQWVFAGTYNSSSSAGHAAGVVRNPSDTSLRFYCPAGAFQARTELTDDGADLYVRYVAGLTAPSPHDNAAHDFRLSVDSGLTEDLAAFSSRLEAETTNITRRGPC
jgi:hypothetical protein